MRRSQNSLMLEALADGQWRSGAELRELALTGRPNSRAAELRKLGYDVRCVKRADALAGRVYGYELVSVPSVAPAIERTLAERAAADLEVLRRTRAGSQVAPSGAAVPDGAAVRPPDGSMRRDGGAEPPVAHGGPGEEDHRTGPGAAVEAATADEPAAPGFACVVDESGGLAEALPPRGRDVAVERDVRELGRVEDELSSLEATCGLSFEELDRLEALEVRREVLERRLGRVA